MPHCLSPCHSGQSFIVAFLILRTIARSFRLPSSSFPACTESGNRSEAEIDCRRAARRVERQRHQRLIALPPPPDPPFDIEKRRGIVGVLDAGEAGARRESPPGRRRNSHSMRRKSWSSMLTIPSLRMNGRSMWPTTDEQLADSPACFNP
jgi:hypothetical protein